MSNDAQPAESSPAPSTPFDLSTLDSAQRHEWQLTGKLPEKAPETSEPEVTPSPADSAPAQPVEQVASTDASSSPVSEPGTPKKANADTRIKELLAERHAERTRREAAERRLAEVEAQLTGKPDAPAVPSPAPSDQFQPFDQWQEKHPDGQYDEYLIAKFEHVQSVKQTAAQREQAQAQTAQAKQERAGTFLKRFEEAPEALKSALDPAVVALRPVDNLGPDEPVTALNLVAQEIMESEQAVALLAHLSAHPEELDALSKMTSPVAVVRRMTKLEAQLALPAIPPPKTQTSAPALSTTLGSRPAIPGDPITTALKSGDFTRYREAANARELASK